MHLRFLKTGIVLTLISITLGLPQPAAGLSFSGDSQNQPTLTECSSWDLAAEFRLSPNQENPNRDSCGNLGVWSFMRGTSLTRDPKTYVILTRFFPNAGLIDGLQAWMGDHQQDSANSYAPSVATNATGAPIKTRNITIPAGAFAVHPYANELVIVGWRSPFTGSVTVSGTIRDLDGNAGDGILWFIDKGAANLVSGNLANSGSQDIHSVSGGSGLDQIAVVEGEYLYFIVHPKGDYGYDSTQLDIQVKKFIVDFTPPTVSAHSLQSRCAGTGPSSFTVSFSEEVNNPAGDANAKDVTNPDNYLLIEKGANKTVNTASCLGGGQADDARVTGATVTYANPTAEVTLPVRLPAGSYRLFVCGTTSIVDLAGNPLLNGTDFTFDFSVDATPPTVSVHSLQSRYAGTGPSSFTVSFSEEVNNPAGDADAKDVTNPDNYLVIEKGANKTVNTASCLGGVQADDARVTRATVTYANPTAEVTLPAPLHAGSYRLFVCGTTSIVDLAGNPLLNGTDFTFDFSVDAIPPTVSAYSLKTIYAGTGPSSFTVTFSEEVNNPAGDADAKDVTNPNNYLLIEKGANKTVDTVSCLDGVQADDTRVTVASVTYANPTATVTLSAPLPAGSYRLFVCGTSSIVDLAGNPLLNGVDFTFDLTISFYKILFLLVFGN